MSRYVLVTAAYNEEKHIEKTLQAVVSQTHRPDRWVIVSDASTDRTDEIVNAYTRQYDFIHMLRITEEHARNFGAQVTAINTGYGLLKALEFEFVANIDADVSFAPTYYEQLLRKFEQDARLGLAGGMIYEEQRGEFRNRLSNNPRSVPHAVQMFRRECFEMIGQYVAMPYGGPDWVAEVKVRQVGWTVRSFDDLIVYHHRPTGRAGGYMKDCVRQGKLAYSVGSHPVFEIAKTVRRLRERPMVIGALVRLGAFAWLCCCQHSRSVPDDFVRYLRNEQRQRMYRFFTLKPHAYSNS